MVENADVYTMRGHLITDILSRGCDKSLAAELYLISIELIERFHCIYCLLVYFRFCRFE